MDSFLLIFGGTTREGKGGKKTELMHLSYSHDKFYK